MNKMNKEAVEFALLLEDVEQVETILGDFLLSVDSESNIDQETFPTTNAKYGEDFTTIVLYFFEEHGYLQPNGSNDWSLDTSYSECIRLLVETWNVERVNQAMAQHLDDVSFEAVCTLPRQDPTFENVEPLDFGMRQITSALLTLCRQAERTLTVVSPFLESEGVGWILPGLEQALARGVDVTVVSRELTTGEPNHSALKDLYAYTKENGGNLTVYDYYKAKENSAGPLYTLHSKLILVDERAAYVGSANFTKYGFSENLEIGVIVRGDAVTRLSKLLTHLTEGSANEVIST